MTFKTQSMDIKPPAASKDNDSINHTFEESKESARNEAQIEQKLTPPFMFAGVAATFLTSVLLSFGLLFIKLHPADGIVEVTTLVFIRGLNLMALSGLTILYQGSSLAIKRAEIFIVSMRSTLSALAPYAAYVSLNYISLGDSTAIVYSSPVWTSLLSYVILGEQLRWIQLIALPACLFSVILIAHPGLIINMAELAGEEIMSEVSMLVNETLALASSSSSSIASDGTIFDNATILLTTTTEDPIYAEFVAQDVSHRWPGILIAVASSLLISGAFITFRIGCTTTIQPTVFYTGFSSCVATFFIMCFIGFGELPASLMEWILVWANSLVGWFGAILIQWSLMYESASIVSVVRTLDVVISFLMSAVFLNEQILWTSILGAAVIILMVILLLVNDWLQEFILRKIFGRRNANHTNGALKA